MLSGALQHQELVNRPARPALLDHLAHTVRWLCMRILIAQGGQEHEEQSMHRSSQLFHDLFLDAKKNQNEAFTRAKAYQIKGAGCAFVKVITA